MSLKNLKIMAVAAIAVAAWLCAPPQQAAACAACPASVRADESIYSGLAVNEGNFQITGVVSGVAYAQNVIEVTVAGAKQSIHVTPTTSIDKHGETGSIADLRVGVHVDIAGVIRDGQHVAVTIQIK
jgi:hypothetical protein